MNYYLIKREPGLSDKGVLLKRNENNKSFFETAIKNKSPLSSKLLLVHTNLVKGDKIT